MACPDTAAVAWGLERTGRIITAAALLFCVAIGSFATSRLVFVQELGVGTRVAVALDATIVRALLVPSLMAILGELELVGAGAAAPLPPPSRVVPRHVVDGREASVSPPRVRLVEESHPKEGSMDLHANAVLTVRQRQRSVIWSLLG